jgi:hypothetical protein
LKQQEVNMAAIVVSLLIVLVIGVVSAVVISHTMQEREVEEIEAEPAGNPFTVLSIALAFDPDHAIVWETQMPALQLIGEAGVRGIKLRRLYAWFHGSARRYPELYDGSTFPQWLDFLENAKLIVRSGGRIVLTAEGIQFMQYRIAAAPAMALATGT